MPRLVVCLSCHEHIKSDATACPHCGASVRTCRALGRGTGAILMGLALGGCPADDGMDSASVGDSTPSTTADDTGTAGTSSGSGTTSDMDTGFFESAAAYGTPDTGVDTLPDDSGTTGDTGSSGGTGSSGTETDAETAGTTLEPEYGIPTTSGN